MALEPVMPTQAHDDSEIRSVQRRFWVSAALSLPVSIIAMLPHVIDLHLTMSSAWQLRAAQVLLTLPVVVWAGAEYYRRGWLGIVNRSPNMYTLIGLGVLVSYVFSLFATSWPNAFPPTMRDEHGMVGVYFESAAVIVTLALLGEWLELVARGKTSLAIRQLMDLAPKTARRIRADGSD
jgi:Cu+-exporting ATPase